MKAISLNYQRNGVSGEGFYTFHYTDKIEKETREFIATFTTNLTDHEIDPITCRVVCLNDITSAWRGDRIGMQIATHFKNTYGQFKDGFYDYIEILQASYSI